MRRNYVMFAYIWGFWRTSRCYDQVRQNSSASYNLLSISVKQERGSSYVYFAAVAETGAPEIGVWCTFWRTLGFGAPERSGTPVEIVLDCGLGDCDTAFRCGSFSKTFRAGVTVAGVTGDLVSHISGRDHSDNPSSRFRDRTPASFFARSMVRTLCPAANPSWLTVPGSVPSRFPASFGPELRNCTSQSLAALKAFGVRPRFLARRSASKSSADFSIFALMTSTRPSASGLI